jgi:hypothetical protein
MKWTGSVLLACAVTACGGDTNGSATVPAATEAGEVRTTSTPSVAEPRSAERDVLAAVEGFVRSTITVNDPPDPAHTDLARYRTGAVLENAVATVSQNRSLGLAFRLPPEPAYSHATTVQSLTVDRSVVRTCVVDDAQLVAQHDGRVLNDAVATKLFLTTLLRVEGGWKVAENSLIDRWEGVAGCAASPVR